MTPDMPVIKGPAERCAEILQDYMDGVCVSPKRSSKAEECRYIALIITAEYASERREMVRVMEGALGVLEEPGIMDVDEWKAWSKRTVLQLRAAILRGKCG